MSKPGIELRWGKGFEEKPRKRESVRPFVRTAINLAQVGMHEMGIPITERKYVVVNQAEPGEKWVGLASGKTCHMQIWPQEIKRRRIDTIWLASYIFHELVHLVHEEYVPDNGMLENAASEGIAHTAQYEFVNTLLARNGRKGPPHRMVEKVRAMPSRDMNKLELEFWKASAKPNSCNDTNMHEWFSRFAPPLNFPRGATVGIHAVSQQLNKGWEIPELITLPPEEVLDAA